VLDAMEKLVLFVMLDRADDDGVLWYANETIAEKASLTSRGVQKVVDRLIAKCIVRKMPRRNATNYYIVQMDKLPAVLAKPRRPKEGTALDFLSQPEPDLFESTGERGSGVTGERGSTTGERRSVRGERGSPDSLNDSSNDSHGSGRAATDDPDDELYELVLTGWNALASRVEALAPCRSLSDARKRLIQLRTEEWIKQAWVGSESNEPPAVQVWKHVFAQIEGSRFLTGVKTDWAIPGIDWILKAGNFLKIMEGNYGRGSDSTNPAIARGHPGGERSAVEAGREALGALRDARQRRSAEDGRAGGHSRSPADAHS
jgi:hypothetical protein